MKKNYPSVVQQYNSLIYEGFYYQASLFREVMNELFISPCCAECGEIMSVVDKFKCTNYADCDLAGPLGC